MRQQAELMWQQTNLMQQQTELMRQLERVRCDKREREEAAAQAAAEEAAAEEAAAEEAAAVSLAQGMPLDPGAPPPFAPIRRVPLTPKCVPADVVRLAKEYVSGGEELEVVKHDVTGFRAKGNAAFHCGELRVMKDGTCVRTLQLISTKGMLCMEVWNGTPPADSPWEEPKIATEQSAMRRLLVRAGCTEDCCRMNKTSKHQCQSARRNDLWKGCQSQVGVKTTVQQAMADHTKKNSEAHRSLLRLRAPGEE